jgi:multidrug resistance efflux pump
MQRLNKMDISKASSAQSSRKTVIFLLAALIALVMVVWLGFIGWGFISLVQWTLDCIKSLLMRHF